MDINSPEALNRIFEECKVIAVVGLSSNPMRPSHGVAGFMRRAGYKVIPVNPNETTVFGEKSYSKLSEIPEPVDLVDIFRRSEEAGAVIDEAIAISDRHKKSHLAMVVNAGLQEFQAHQAGSDIPGTTMDAARR